MVTEQRLTPEKVGSIHVVRSNEIETIKIRLKDQLVRKHGWRTSNAATAHNAFGCCTVTHFVNGCITDDQLNDVVAPLIKLVGELRDEFKNTEFLMTAHDRERIEIFSNP